MKNICHRDLKPENILIGGGRVYISDLGSSKFLVGKCTPYVVARYYRSPELIMGVLNYTLSIDTWSFGVIAYELLTGVIPFIGNSEGNQLV